MRISQNCKQSSLSRLRLPERSLKRFVNWSARGCANSIIRLMIWDDIFAIIGPSLIEPDPEWSVPKVMLPVIEQRVLSKLRRQWPGNRFQRFLISSTDADAILLQLRALKLITFDEPKGWCLTP